MVNPLVKEIAFYGLLAVAVLVALNVYGTISELKANAQYDCLVYREFINEVKECSSIPGQGIVYSCENYSSAGGLWSWRNKQFITPTPAG